MNGGGLNFVNVSVLFVGIVLVYAGIKGKSPIAVLQDAVANTKAPAASASGSDVQPMQGMQAPQVMTDPMSSGH